MTNNYMKQYSKSLITRELKIKTRMRYNVTLPRMAIIRRQKVTGGDKDMEKGEPSCYC